MWKDITIKGRKFHVFIEDGYITRGIIGSEQSPKPAYIYRSLASGWGKESKVTEAAFRAGVARGTLELM